MSSIESTDDILRRLMSASTLRARVLTENIANQSTPGYKRRDVVFEELLEEALHGGKPTVDVEPSVIEDVTTPSRPDGNNVELEIELNAMRENRILYETYVAIVEGRGGIKRAAIGNG